MLSLEDKEIVTPCKLVICVVGFKRSGNHAIINWIAQQYGEHGRVLHLNCPRALSDPFRTARNGFLYEPGREVAKLQRPISDMFSGKCDCIICSYETTPLFLLSNRFSRLWRRHLVGMGFKAVNALILRDPFNTAASRQFVSAVGFSPFRYPELYLRHWKSYAREFLGVTNHLGNDRVSINYNRWTQDIGYRKEVARALGIPFSDKGFREIRGFARSSFDASRMNGVADQMGVHTRWAQYSDDARFWTLFKDQELLDLSHRAFGTVVDNHYLCSGNFHPSCMSLARLITQMAMLAVERITGRLRRSRATREPTTTSQRL